MVRITKRVVFEVIYFIFACSILFWVAATLQAGSAGVYLFIANDVSDDPQRLAFMLGFLAAYLTSHITLQYVLRLPRFDYFNRVISLSFVLRLPKFDFFSRIIAINIVAYSFLGLVLSTLRLPLVSREVFLIEFLVSSSLLIIYYKLVDRNFPR